MPFTTSAPLFKAVLITLIALFALTGCASAQVENPMPATATATPHAALRQIQAEVDRYESLAAAAASEEERLYYEEKMNQTAIWITRAAMPTPSSEELGHIFATQEAAVNNYTPKPTPTHEFGILESGIHFEIQRPRRVWIDNIWQGYVGDDISRVYAGLLIPDPRTGDFNQTDHGAVYVTTLHPDNSVTNTLITTHELPYPFTEPGFLHITTADNDQLSLRNEQGLNFTFDLITLVITPAPPSAPHIIQAIYTGPLHEDPGQPPDDVPETYVTLAWNPVVPPPETRFNIYRSPTLPVPLEPSALIATDVTDSTYLDEDGYVGDYYVLTAVNAIGTSSPSNTAAATTDNGCPECN